MKKLINYIKRRWFTPRYVYNFGSCYLFRVDTSNNTVQLSGNKPNDWTSCGCKLLIQGDIDYLIRNKVTEKQAKEKYPNATF